MIFVTVGTTRFDKLIAKVDQLVADGVIRDRVYAQIGTGKYTPQHLEWIRYVKDMSAVYAEADMVICHGGTGTVFPQLEMGLSTLPVPNRDLQDDHQSDLLRAIEDQGWCTVCWDLDHLGELLESNVTHQPYRVDKSLTQTVWDDIAELPLCSRGRN